MNEPFKEIMAELGRVRYNVVTDRGTIRCNTLRNAGEIYGFYDHARVERFNLSNGTKRTIKEK